MIGGVILLLISFFSVQTKKLHCPGRNHPAPLLTVREESGLYRYATELEYINAIDTKGVRQRRYEDAAWEFEWIRRRQVCGWVYVCIT